jgi:hypothetical protein
VGIGVAVDDLSVGVEIDGAGISPGVEDGKRSVGEAGI